MKSNENMKLINKTGVQLANRTQRLSSTSGRKVVNMPCEANHQFESLQAGLLVVSELDEQIVDEDARPQLEQARSYLAQAGKNIGISGFDRNFSKAMGVASSVAVTHGYDDLAEDALELGGDRQ